MKVAWFVQMSDCSPQLCSQCALHLYRHLRTQRLPNMHRHAQPGYCAQSGVMPSSHRMPCLVLAPSYAEQHKVLWVLQHEL
jgi:hypothetical protein